MLEVDGLRNTMSCRQVIGMCHVTLVVITAGHTYPASERYCLPCSQGAACLLVCHAAFKWMHSNGL